VTIRRDFPRAAGYTTTIAVSGDGLIQVALNGEALAKPSMLLKTPLKAGTKWESNAGGRYEATKEEEVEVPAGRFRAVRVELVQGDRKMTLWFAPGVGQIKTVEAGSDRVHVLKEFKPGK
jgi:hypothetical protein